MKKTPKIFARVMKEERSALTNKANKADLSDLPDHKYIPLTQQDLL
jgi:hypothetical protein